MKDFDDFDGELENLDKSSTSDDRQTSADAEAHLKMVVVVMTRVIRWFPISLLL